VHSINASEFGFGECCFTCDVTSVMSANDYTWFKRDIHSNNCCNQTASC